MRSLPLGLLSLAAVLEQEGIHSSIIDFNYALAEGEIALDDAFYTDAAALIAETAPDVIGFSTMCNSYHIALRIARNAKALLPGVPIIFGGPQASVVDGETLAAFPFVDMVLRGEAEQNLPRLLRALEGGQPLDQIPGLTRRINGRIERAPEQSLLRDLDALPVPAYHLFPYGVGEAPSIDVGRGCPFACSFCSTSTYWRRRFRLKSNGRVIQEMKMLKQDFNSSHFTFMHDLFTVNRGQLLDFCAALQAEHLDVTWSCSARVDCVDRELLDRMADSGCRAIFFGVEAGSPRMQREINKNLDLDRLWSTVDATLGAKIRPTFSFIAGFPTETEADLSATMAVIQSLLEYPVATVQLHLLSPQTGTPDYERHHDRLRFDGYYSDIAGADYRFLEPEWFQRHPQLFNSFYYFDSPGLSRDLVRGLDLFVHGPCSTMRETVARLLSERRNLWGLYRRWRNWSDPRGVGAGPMAGQSLDQYLLDFYAFASDEVGAGRADFDLGIARDEILAFYLRFYGQVPVRFMPPEAAEKACLPEVCEGV